MALGVDPDALVTVGMSSLTSFGINRLQRLSEAAPKIVCAQDETTSAFLIRRNEYIQNVSIPISVQIVRETFPFAGLVTLISFVLVAIPRSRRHASDEFETAG